MFTFAVPFSLFLEMEAGANEQRLRWPDLERRGRGKTKETDTMNDLMTIIRQRYSEEGTIRFQPNSTDSRCGKDPRSRTPAPDIPQYAEFFIVVVDDERLLNRLGSLNTIPSPEVHPGKL